MFEVLKNWWRSRTAVNEPARKPPARATVNRGPSPRPAAPDQFVRQESIEFDAEPPGEVESLGPGKNVLIRNKYVREETGTHETLKILDDSMLETGEEDGIDPYNTGGFDRSRNWDTRFRK